MPDTRTCKDCPFWDQQGTRTVTGACRVNPPIAIAADQNFPITGASDWCSIIRPGIRIEEWNPNLEEK